jgi:hypothetical protein
MTHHWVNCFLIIYCFVDAKICQQVVLTPLTVDKSPFHGARAMGIWTPN